MALRQRSIPESKIHYLLSSPRRCHALRYLEDNPGSTTLRELSEAVAAIEAGQSPPPRAVRERVYISLHQSHLPALDKQGVVEYDIERKEIRPLPGSRDVRLHMEVVTRYGITWAEYYRYLGILGLFVVVAGLAGLPLVSAVDPLLWASGFLALFALSTGCQFWKERYALLRWFGNGRNL